MDPLKKQLKLFKVIKATKQNQYSSHIKSILFQCDSNDNKFLEKILKNFKDDANNTLLIHAISENMNNLASRIIDSKYSNLNAVSDYGYTALILACEKKMIDVALKIIIKDNHTIDYVPKNHDKYNETALFVACKNGLSSVAITIIKINNNNCGIINRYLSTPLIWACCNKMNDVAIELLNTGKSNPQQVNDKGYTALIWSIVNDMENVANMIINMNTTSTYLKQIDENGNDALIYACKYKMEDVAIKILNIAYINIDTGNKIPKYIVRQNKFGNNALDYILYNNLENIKDKLNIHPTKIVWNKKI